MLQLCIFDEVLIGLNEKESWILMSDNFLISWMWLSCSNLGKASSLIPTTASIHSDFMIMSTGPLGEWLQPFKILIKTHALATLQSLQ